MLRLLMAVVLLLGVPVFPAWTQDAEYCSTDGDSEPPSDTLRTVELPDFGLAVDIPSNYRAMKRQNGTVEILHPDDFEMLRCIAQGGLGASGYYSETIELVEPDPAMSLREQAMWSVGYALEADGRLTPAYTQMIEYDQNGFSGYIVRSSSGFAVTFLGNYPGGADLLNVTAGCDCDVEMQAVTDLLSNITVLE
ncbi:hypothetical protein C7271_24680 [filamentous cyanobacterium CCP5]|nr:hypothetical protein C7271_24680 [filamentous cyanobacterium CCP5]